MKSRLLEILICPVCLPQESPLELEGDEPHGEDIETGTLICRQCGTVFPISSGIAFLDPLQNETLGTENKYEQEEVVSSYLWSHYSDLFDSEFASDAYTVWSELVAPSGGIGLDAGGAVGRFTFELSTKCDFAVGIDNSVAFVRAARTLMKERGITFALKEEGEITRDAFFHLPEEWDSSKVEFVVGNALALPFCRESISTFASLNLIDKVPSPKGHLQEMDRVSRSSGAQFILSDPFSWSEEAADKNQWLGGRKEGQYSGKGLDNIAGLLAVDNGVVSGEWQVGTRGQAWWKIRTHTNHFELIRSCYLNATR